MTDAPDADDETTVVTQAAAAASPDRVWDVLVHHTDRWWAAPYLGPGEGAMRLEARLGGAVWAETDAASEAPDHADSTTDGSPETVAASHLHGTIRAFDPPERLEIGGVLVPGAYAGSITITVEETSLGAEIRVEHMARGRVTASTEEKIAHGWSDLTAKLAELADASGDP